MTIMDHDSWEKFATSAEAQNRRAELLPLLRLVFHKEERTKNAKNGVKSDFNDYYIQPACVTRPCLHHLPAYRTGRRRSANIKTPSSKIGLDTIFSHFLVQKFAKLEKREKSTYLYPFPQKIVRAAW